MESCTDLVSCDTVCQRLLDAVPGYCADDKIWKSRLEGHEEVQHRDLQGIVCSGDYIPLQKQTEMVHEPVYA